MKKQFLFILTATSLMTACGPRDNKVTVTDSKGEKTTVSVTPGNVTVTSEDVQAKVEELKKLPPVSTETMKSFFPEEAMGIKRSSFNVSSAMGYSVGNAEYRKDDNVKYDVGIYDCVGEAGSVFYYSSWAGMNLQSESDQGYTKTVEYNGAKALETYTKANNRHNLHFLSGDRFWVMVEGNDGIDNLKSFASSLGLDKLKAK
ncbi:MAG TPA: hypothetical protein VFZ47_07310, partial [Chitinophagaceae bacterium]